MRAAYVNDQRIITNVIIVSDLSDFPGTVECPAWLGIGQCIDDPAPIVIASAQQNKEEAVKRLNETDWVNQPDVYDPANTPHLTNRDEFLSYRAFCRNIAVNPYDGNIDWPTEPKAVWS